MKKLRPHTKPRLRPTQDGHLMHTLQRAHMSSMPFSAAYQRRMCCESHSTSVPIKSSPKGRKRPYFCIVSLEVLAPAAKSSEIGNSINPKSIFQMVAHTLVHGKESHPPPADKNTFDTLRRFATRDSTAYTLSSMKSVP